jgi:hypothetical protein
MLQSAERRGDDSIVAWLPCERAFKVHEREPFENRIIREFFNQTKYKSFQRQLNLWGFERITDADSPKLGAYYHPLFIKGRRELCPCMTRLKIKNRASEATVPVQQVDQQAPLLGDLPSLSSAPRVESSLSSTMLYRQLLPASGYGAENFAGRMSQLDLPLASRQSLHSQVDLLISRAVLQRDAEFRAIRSQTALASLVLEEQRRCKQQQALNALLALSAAAQRSSFASNLAMKR